MRTFTLFLLSVGIGLGSAQAQTSISFGPRVGANFSTATFNTTDQATSGVSSLTTSRSSLIGAQIGLTASIGHGPWLLQPSVVFSQKGLKQTATASENLGSETLTATLDATSRINFLELPINVVYAFGTDGQGWQIFGGPYVAVGVGGKASYTEKVTSTDPNSFLTGQESGSQGYAFGSTFPDFDPNGNSSGTDARVRRLDAGFNVGAGYRTGPFQLQLSYAFGMLNAQPDYPASYQMPNQTGYHRNTQLVFSYFLPKGGQ